jgi:hypothetical protein
MKRSGLFLIGLVAILFLSLQLNAQPNTRRENYWAIGAQLNAFNYFGDLNPVHQYQGTRLDFTRPNISIHVSRKMTDHWHLRGSLGYGRLKGDDFNDRSLDKVPTSGELSADNLNRAARYGRNLHFRNDIIELAVSAQYDIFASRGRFYRRRYVNPYVLGGIGVFSNTPMALSARGAGGEKGEWTKLRPLGTEGQGLDGYRKKYGWIQPNILFGVGVKFRISDRFDFGVESAVRFLFTDHLDDVSGRYANMLDLQAAGRTEAMRFADRSAEPLAAVSGDARNLAKIRPIVGQESSGYGSINDVLNNIPLVNIPGFQRLSSYGLEGDIRGNGTRKGSNGISQNDIYLVTGFHLNYILTTKRHPRYKVRQ